MFNACSTCSSFDRLEGDLESLPEQDSDMRYARRSTAIAAWPDIKITALPYVLILRVIVYAIGISLTNNSSEIS
jgi:hypothetical protein